MPRTATVKKREFASAEARDEFILGNVGLGKKIANEGSSMVGMHGLEFDDLLQAAWLEITKAADYFDQSRARFDNYAYSTVQRGVRNAAINQANPVIVNEGQFGAGNKSVRTKETDEAIVAAKKTRSTSLEFEPLSQAESVEDSASRREHHRMLLKALVTLPARERWVVMHAYGIGCEVRSQQSIADALGLRKQRVGQIRDSAFARLRRILSSIGDEL